MLFHRRTHGFGWRRGLPAAPVAALVLLQSHVLPVLPSADPPRIVVSPAKVVVTMPVGTRTTRTVTVENQGGSDLAFTASVRRRVGALGGMPRALILESGIDVSEIRLFLETLGGFSSIQTYDAGASTPGLPFLLSYSAVIVVANRPFADPVLLGDVLAAYAERGGGVVLTLASFIEGWEIRGRFLSDGFMPFDLGTRALGETTLTGPAPAHPLTARVDSAWAEIIGEVKVAREGIPIAFWDGGRPLAALARENVAALNLFVGGTGFWTGDAARLLRNAALFTSGGVPWVGVRPPSGNVPAGGNLDVTLSFDASDVDAGDDLAFLVLESQDPERPVVAVPLRFRGEGTPSLVVAGEDVVVESVRDYTTRGVETFHDLPLALPPAAGGTLELVVIGDYNEDGETATARVEGALLGGVGRTLVCGSALRTFPLTPARLEALAADGNVRVEVRASPTVDAFCGVNRHVVRLRHTQALDRVDFGTIFVGASREAVLSVHNNGSGVLEIASIASDAEGFFPSVSSMSVPPRRRDSVRVAFAPESAGTFAGTLRLTSNDPALPVRDVRLEGSAIEPPVIDVRPSQVSATLLEGRRQTRTLTVSNLGGSVLDLSARLRGRPGAPVSRDRCAFSSAAVVEATRGSLRVVDLTTAAAREVASNLGGPYGVALDPGSGIAYVTEYFEGELSAVDLASGAIRVVARGLDTPVGVILDQDARTAFVVEADPGRLTAVDLATGAMGAVAAGLAYPTYLALGEARTVYVTQNETGELSAVDLLTGEVRRVASGLTQPRGLALDPVRGVAYVCEFGRGVLDSIDLATGRVRALADGLAGPFALVLDPSGARAFVAESRAGRISTIDLVAGTVSPLSSGLSFPADLAAMSSRGCLKGFLGVEPTASAVPPLGTETLVVSLDPVEIPGGRYDVELELASNDPASPVVTVPIALTVIGAPEVEATPSLVEASVPRGARGSSGFRVCNRGVEILDFTLRVGPCWTLPVGATDSAPGGANRGRDCETLGVRAGGRDGPRLPGRTPRWLSLSPQAGSVFPAGCAEITAAFDAAAARPGDSAATIAVWSNDPDEPVVPIRAVIHVP